MWTKAITDDFIVVAISCGDNHDHDENRKVVGVIESHRPAYWQFSNPDSYLIYFRGKRKEKQSAAMVDQIKRWTGIRIGMSSGRLTTQITLFGKVTSPPVGGSISEAIKKQSA